MYIILALLEPCLNLAGIKRRSSRFFLSERKANFASARKQCELNGMKLATLATPEDVEAFSYVGNGT